MEDIIIVYHASRKRVLLINQIIKIIKQESMDFEKEVKYMKYKISNVYINVNGEDIAVGVALGEEDKPQSPYRTEYVTNSEYEKGLKEFRYGKQQIGDMVYHLITQFKNFTATYPIKQKWIDELEKMGYDISKLKYEIAE